MKKIIFAIVAFSVALLTNAQNVGIGTTVPKSEMHLHSGTSSFNLQMTNNITSDATNRGSNLRMLGSNLYMQNQETGGSINFSVENIPALSMMKYGSSSTHVGVGTTLPDANLHIHEPTIGDNVILMTNGDYPTTPGGALFRLSNNNFHISNYYPGNFKLAIGAVPVISMFSNYNAAIGAIYTAPVEKLRVMADDNNTAAIKADVLSSSTAVALDISNGALKVSGTRKTAFQITATAGNISANGLVIPNTTLANNPNDLLTVTPVFTGTGVYCNFPIGVWWNGSNWVIFNQNGFSSIMPVDAAFNVLVIKQ